MSEARQYVKRRRVNRATGELLPMADPVATPEREVIFMDRPIIRDVVREVKVMRDVVRDVVRPVQAWGGFLGGLAVGAGVSVIVELVRWFL